MRIILTEEFEKEYVRLPVFIQRKAEKQQNIFKINPLHPSLHTEKLHPKSKSVWSFRVDKNYRVVFRVLEKDKVVFIAIGPHDWIYKQNF
jgi:mRNA-degrading endonuclease RelE of RelBE toxin-antitoxin system